MNEKDTQYHGFPDCLQYVEIQQILNDIFEIIEIRAKVGIVGNIIMELRMKEEGHNIPHIHAKYENNNISISLVDFSVLAGNIPKKNQKIAIQWTRDNQLLLRNKWNGTHQIFEFPVTGMCCIKKQAAINTRE